MVQLLEKIKDCPGKFHSWYKSSLGYPIRKPNSNISTAEEIKQFESDIPKVAEIKQTTTMKNIFYSKSFWLAVIPIAVGVLNYIEGALTQGTVLTIFGVVMIILRLVTKEAVYIPGIGKKE